MYENTIPMIPEQISSIIDEIDSASREVPFGNSTYQIDNFLINAEATPGRAYRSVLLQLTEKVKALKEAQFNVRRSDIDIDELEDKLERGGLTPFELRRVEVDLEEKRWNRQSLEKLVMDALVEVNHLYKRFKQLPAYTREQFEVEEEKHFASRLRLQALGLGNGTPQRDLLDMGAGLPENHPLRAAIKDLLPARLTDQMEAGQIEAPAPVKAIEKKEE